MSTVERKRAKGRRRHPGEEKKSSRRSVAEPVASDRDGNSGDEGRHAEGSKLERKKSSAVEEVKALFPGGTGRCDVHSVVDGATVTEREVLKTR